MPLTAIAEFRFTARLLLGRRSYLGREISVRFHLKPTASIQTLAAS